MFLKRFKLFFYKYILSRNSFIYLTPHSFYMLNNSWDKTFQFSLMGSYDKIIQDEILNESSPFTFVDIGANQGFYSLIAGKNSKCKKLYAFEPNPMIYTFLIRNLNKNKLNALSICSAISDKNGCSHVKFNPSHSGTLSLEYQANVSNSISITTMNHLFLKEIFKDLTFPIVIKIDVEGHENTVIDELIAARLLNLTKKIIVEASADKSSNSFQSLRDKLARNNFKLVRHGSGETNTDYIFEHEF